MKSDNNLITVLKDDGIEEVDWGKVRKFENSPTVGLDQLRKELGMGSWAVRIAYNNLFGGVIRPVIKIQTLWSASLKKCSTKGINHIFRVIPIEKLPVGNHPAGIINKCNKESLTPFAIRLFDRRAIHRISLP